MVGVLQSHPPTERGGVGWEAGFDSADLPWRDR